VALAYYSAPSRRCRVGRPSTDAQAMSEELPFSVVRSNVTDDVLARAVNMLIPRGAYREAAKMYPDELIELRQGARVIERSSRSFGDIYLCGRA
jgi:hypothetical protein